MTKITKEIKESEEKRFKKYYCGEFIEPEPEYRERFCGCIEQKFYNQNHLPYWRVVYNRCGKKHNTAR